MIIEHPVAQYIASKQTDCGLQAIKTNSGKSSWNVAFQKTSPWKEMVSKKILQYKEKGFFDDVTTKWIKTSCTDKSSINLTSQKYKIENFSGLVIIFICLLIVSAIILIIESWIFKWKKKSSSYSFERQQHVNVLAIFTFYQHFSQSKSNAIISSLSNIIYSYILNLIIQIYCFSLNVMQHQIPVQNDNQSCSNKDRFSYFLDFHYLLTIFLFHYSNCNKNCSGCTLAIKKSNLIHYSISSA